MSQGEAFIISKSGTVEKPTAKLFKVEANARLFDLCNNSVTFFEDFPGQFSMEFEYHLPVCISLGIVQVSQILKSSLHVYLRITRSLR